MKKLLKENLVEILALFIIFIGIFAFFRRDMVNKFINQILPGLQIELTRLTAQFVRQGTEMISQLTIYEMIVFGLAFLGFLFIIFRVRYRVFHSQRWRSPVCPRCGNELYRVHRTWIDRLLGKTFLPHSGRYLCQDADCGWTGLKSIDRGRRQQRSEAETFGFDSSE